jgi:crotonobetainyl-CoA:carnitine CoA-transferase CaiB-like acyl-CoA transferase
VPASVVWLSRTPLRHATRIAAPQPFRAAGGARPALERAPTRDAPLRGLRVIDLGPFTAGPLTTRYLSDLGAEVTKVEPPGGERSRDWQPRAGHASHYFANYNCGKRSVELDLGTPDGVAGLRALLAGADVFVQNLKPGALRKLGIDIDALVAAQPRLIVCSISGYGRTAPPAAALDMVVQAGAGLMALVDGPTECGPLKTGFSYGDLTAAHVAAFAILAALVERDRSGRGQLIDVAMHDALVWLTQLGWPGVPAPTHAVDGDDRGWTLRVAGETPEPVLEVAAAVNGDDARRRGTLRPVRAGADGVWQVLASPHRWRSASPEIGAFVAVTGSDNLRVQSARQH